MKVELRRWVVGATLALSFAAMGCSAVGAEDEDESALGTEEGELRTALDPGTKVVTIANVNLRKGPSTSFESWRVLPNGTKLIVIDGEPEEKFYRVKTERDEVGWVHGAYIEEANTPTNPGTGGPANFSGETFRSRGTGYYPANNAMEGGFVDRRGARLRTLQGFLSGRDEYVSVAMDSNAFNYGQKLRIKELEQKYGRQIEFRVVDTGGAFRGRGRTRMDICTANSAAAHDPVINSTMTVLVVR